MVEAALNQSTHVVNVKDLGAKGDGVADDTKAIKKALAFARSEGSITVLIPDGVYRVTDGFVVWKNTHIKLSKNATIKREHSGYIFLNNNRKVEVLGKKGGPSGYKGNGNITIEGGILDMDGATNQSRASCISFAHAENLQFRNIIIKDVCSSHGIEVNSSKNVIIEGCSFKGLQIIGDFNYVEAIQIDLARKGAFNAFGKWDHTPCQDVFILNNICEASENCEAWPRFLGSHTSTIGKYHERIVVKGNIIRNTKQWAIRLYSWRYSTIEGNILDCCAGGITIDSPNTGKPKDTIDEKGKQTGNSQCVNGFTVLGNQIRGGGSFGSAIRLSGEATGKVFEVTIAKNVIGTCAGIGIKLEYADKVTVADNIVNAVERNGFQLKNVNDTKVQGNTLRMIGSNGISIDSSKFINVSLNNMSLIGSNGVYVTANSDSVIVNGNNITGVNGLKGAGKDINHVRMTDGVLRAAITGNVFCNNASNYSTSHAVYVTSTCSNIAMTGNNGIGFTLYNGAKGDVGAQGNLT